jgi:hypothetical protein
MARTRSRSLRCALEPRIEGDIFIKLMGRHDTDMESESAQQHTDTTDTLMYI